LTDESKAALQAFWRHRRYLILDEFSMLAKSFLALLARQIGIAMEGLGLDGTYSFGGISVILCGDLHQFPPVARSPLEALFRPANLAADNEDRLLGRKIYEEFTTVVILKQQIQVVDSRWRLFLDNLRYGRVTQDDVVMLRGLVIGEPGKVSDVSEERWSSVSLVTPRHAVWKAWNNAALRKWCHEKGEPLFVVSADDRIKGRTLTLKERYTLAGRMKTEQRRKRKDLPAELELARGMKVMVTSNIQTDLDLANGARGEIVDFVLHPDEPPLEAGSIIRLKYLPVYVLVKMHRTRA
ncbi:hypothetical protein C8Q79DRAFT_875430, partial [Trametes meyenii]